MIDCESPTMQSRQEHDSLDQGTAGPAIDIALAVFNGESYLEPLIESVFAQTRTDFILSICDDGSTDATLEIVAAAARAHPGRVRLFACDGHVGPAANFSRLLARLDGDITLLCDQDDLWLSDKVETTVRAMARLEAQWGAATPLLVHTDLSVVASDLRMIDPSLARYQRLDPASSLLRQLLLGNVVTGCTLAMNRALRERVLPVPAQASMHDHWIALVASVLGRTAYVPRATLLYRQHDGNVIGAAGWSMRAIARRVRQTLLDDTKLRVLQRYSAQARILVARHGDEMAPRERDAAQAVAGLWGRSRAMRLWLLLRHRLGLPGAVRTLATLAALLRDPGAGTDSG